MPSSDSTRTFRYLSLSGAFAERFSSSRPPLRPHEHRHSLAIDADPHGRAAGQFRLRPSVHAQRFAAADVDLVLDVAALENEPDDAAGNLAELVSRALRRNAQVLRPQHDVDLRARRP